MLRPIIAVAAAAFLTLTLAASEASARSGSAADSAAADFMVDFAAGSAAAASIAASASAISDRVRLRRGLRYGALCGYPYYHAGYDGCLAPRRVWTPYGWRIRWVNVCYCAIPAALREREPPCALIGGYPGAPPARRRRRPNGPRLCIRRSPASWRPASSPAGSRNISSRGTARAASSSPKSRSGGDRPERRHHQGLSERASERPRPRARHRDRRELKLTSEAHRLHLAGPVPTC